MVLIINMTQEDNQEYQIDFERVLSRRNVNGNLYACDLDRLYGEPIAKDKRPKIKAMFEKVLSKINGSPVKFEF